MEIEKSVRIKLTPEDHKKLLQLAKNENRSVAGQATYIVQNSINILMGGKDGN